jgi:glyoxylase-like metal-dependent hydrolase (beta-lactamase superfamily II)
MSTTFTVGDMTIHRVIEDEKPFFDPLTFLPTLTPEVLAENRGWMEKMGALDPTTGELLLCIQSYIVRTPHHTIMIDSCVGNDKPRPTRPFWNMMKGTAYMDGLAAHGLKVEDIDYVMCTHLHVDHVGWNTRLLNGRWVPTFPNARYIFAQKEYDYWVAENAKEELGPIADSVLPIVAAKQADLVSSDFQLNDHVRLTPTPGHTPDHFAVLLGKSGKDAVVSGDLIHSPLQARYPELVMRADYDQQQAAVTRRKFLECHCDTGTLVCTGHFPSPSTGKVSRWGDGFRFTASK